MAAGPPELDQHVLEAAVPRWLDVSVNVGVVPTRLAEGTEINSWLSATDSEALVTLRTGTRLLATCHALVIDPAPEATTQELSYLLYSWGTRIVLSLRKQFSLHASAFLSGNHAVALIGHSNAGKSTTLLGLHERGYPAVVDDLLAVRFESEATVATCSGWPRPVHVRANTAAQMPQWDHGPTIDVRVRPDQPRLADAVTQEVHNVPLACAVHLTRSKTATEVTIDPIAGAVKLAIIKSTVDRFGQSSFAGRDAAFFSWAAGVADRVPMYRLTRPTGDWSLPEVLDKIEGLLRDRNSGE